VKEGAAAGRKPLYLAFDFGGTKVDMALATEGPHIIERKTLETRAERGAVQAVERALAAGRELVDTHGDQALSAVGVSTMGYTREDGVDLAPNVPGWEVLRLPEAIRRDFPDVPVALDNDVRAAAIAELKWGALAGVSAGLYVNFGTGVASSVVIDGVVYQGRHGLAGEVGSWLVQSSEIPSDHSSSRSLAAPSSLETEVGGAGVRNRAQALGLAGGFAELMVSSDRTAMALVDDVLQQIAMNVTNMAILLDPARIVLGGGYAGSGDRLVAVITDSLRQHAPAQPEVVIGRFGSNAGLYGAVAVAESVRPKLDDDITGHQDREGTPGR
jgi:glucokinase